jgi:hypothetical protein
MNRNLVVCFYQIFCGENFPATKVVYKVGNVLDGILVGDSPSVQSTIVATGSPPVFFLGDQVERRSPWAIRTPGSAIPEHLREFGFRDLEAVRC